METLANAMVVIILQFVSVSNKHVVHLQGMSIISQRNCREKKGMACDGRQWALEVISFCFRFFKMYFNAKLFCCIKIHARTLL